MYLLGMWPVLRWYINCKIMRRQIITMELPSLIFPISRTHVTASFLPLDLKAISTTSNFLRCLHYRRLLSWAHGLAPKRNLTTALQGWSREIETAFKLTLIKKYPCHRYWEAYVWTQWTLRFRSSISCYSCSWSCHQTRPTQLRS